MIEPLLKPKTIYEPTTSIARINEPKEAYPMV